eukprot:CAMPEP_0194141256 /NCGR_PEP_ID=MMETSP0152-20130528/10686_1 /TAXON_ID=1049557 /ORGANISM="Thalassiothrix antarctica, Strain L6-D1" /LENGTH=448 /DNA_ID=CAMNT_0038839807 /DNA_START=58 /DNA_END=1404 /DNA_ORIENTATION=-
MTTTLNKTATAFKQSYITTTKDIGSSSSSNNDNSTTKKGNIAVASLNVAILSAYDLPLSEHPLGVEVSCLGQSVMTDAPSARHKDRNSFKFGSNQTLSIQSSSLPQLYKTNATITVKYRIKKDNEDEDNDGELSATIPLKSLKLQEMTWLVLNLSDRRTTDSGYKSNDSDGVPPTLRVQVRLEGPYRPEIGFFLSLGNAWFSVVDKFESSICKLTDTIPSFVKKMDPKYLLIPAVPLATGIVVASPILLGLMIVFLPFLLPVLVALFVMTVGATGLGLGLYASTLSGRTYLADCLSPFLHTILSTPSGQRLVYETGPRPTPVSVARVVMPHGWQAKLLISLFIDLLGSSSYLLPLVGEFFDIAWAPLQTTLLMAMYDAVSPSLKYISFIEEILPFTDIVPSATMGWIKEFGLPMLIGITAGVANPAAMTSNTNLATANTDALLRQKKN